MWRWDTIVPTAPPIVQGGTPIYDSLVYGSRSYELSNHLGNVLSTISDKKVGHNNGSNVVDYYVADVLSQNDYYPFGLEMPNRSYNATYPYSFNGKRDDKDANSGYQDYGIREYDKKTSRFISVDPITSEYPELTPYQFASNRPIDGIDQDGLEWAWSHKGNYIWKGFNNDGSIDNNTLAKGYAKIGDNKYFFSSDIKSKTGFIEIEHKDGTTRHITIHNNHNATFEDRQATKPNSEKLSEVLGTYIWGGSKTYQYGSRGLIGMKGMSGAEINTDIVYPDTRKDGSLVSIYPESIAVPLPKIGKLIKGVGEFFGIGTKAAAKAGSNLTIRSDIVLSGGRSGQLVKTLEGPTNSVLKGGQGRIFITNDAGKVIWDVTKDRAKSVIPGQGFGPKITPTQEQLNLLKQIWGH